MDAPQKAGKKTGKIGKIAMASALALATALPALEQPDQDYPRLPHADRSAPQYQPTPQYQQDREQYQRDRDAYDARKDAYDARRDNYEDSRADYRAARADYERRRANWERARADYDRRYGYGAYTRAYGPEPAWDAGS